MGSVFTLFEKIYAYFYPPHNKTIESSEEIPTILNLSEQSEMEEHKINYNSDSPPPMLADSDDQDSSDLDFETSIEKFIYYLLLFCLLVTLLLIYL